VRDGALRYPGAFPGGLFLSRRRAAGRFARIGAGCASRADYAFSLIRGYFVGIRGSGALVWMDGT